MNDWLRKHLVCPRDRSPLSSESSDCLSCAHGHSYPVVNGLPVMLVDEMEPTHRYCSKTLQLAKRPDKTIPSVAQTGDDVVDPFVQNEIVGTCGHMYKALIGRLTHYPIPDFPLPTARPNQYLLDVGCNWGRWCISAGRKGYIPVGIDPCLDAVVAARKVARQLGIPAIYLVADARCLPFADDSFSLVFSYSVLQHFDKQVVRLCLTEISRTLQPEGISLVQMPNRYGMRQLYNQVRRAFQDNGHFAVRYWTPGELLQTFRQYMGPTALTIDGFFSLNVQRSDMHILPLRFRGVVALSLALRRLGSRIPSLSLVADSLYVKTINEKRYVRGYSTVARRSL